MVRKISNPSIVYLIECRDKTRNLVKVGYTSRLKQRLSSMRHTFEWTMNAEITLLLACWAGKQLESELIRMVPQQLRAIGREWFKAEAKPLLLALMLSKRKRIVAYPEPCKYGYRCTCKNSSAMSDSVLMTAGLPSVQLPKVNEEMTLRQLLAAHAMTLLAEDSIGPTTVTPEPPVPQLPEHAPSEITPFGWKIIERAISEASYRLGLERPYAFHLAGIHARAKMREYSHSQHRQSREEHGLSNSPCNPHVGECDLCGAVPMDGHCEGRI